MRKLRRSGVLRAGICKVLCAFLLVQSVPLQAGAVEKRELISAEAVERWTGGARDLPEPLKDAPRIEETEPREVEPVERRPARAAHPAAEHPSPATAPSAPPAPQTTRPAAAPVPSASPAVAQSQLAVRVDTPERAGRTRALLPAWAGEFPPTPPGGMGLNVAGAPDRRLLEKDASSEIPLLTGWNLLSLPKQPANPSPSAVFGGSASRVFAYDACNAADPWKVWSPSDPGGSDLTSVDHKIGFWLEANPTAALPVAGSEPATTTIHLCPGWNLIGYPVPQERPVAGALASISGKYARVFGFDPFDVADPWEIYDVTVPAWANDLQMLQPGRGYWVLATAETDLVFRSTAEAPVVQIASPLDLSEVTTFTPVVGTVTSDLLERWTLSYRAAGETAWTQIATGTAPVTNASLGTFDPTLLLNGLYEVQLAATDVNGQESTVELGVAVEGQQKIGNFTLTFRDLEIPLSGLPIQVLRTYDSRDKRQGDFGIGWTLELRQGSYRNNRKPGDGWQFASGFLPCERINESRKHLTTIRLSDREVYRFKIALQRGAPTLGGCFGTARFDFVDGPVPGATLAILGNKEVLYQNGDDQVLDADSFEVYEPQQVRLTTRDGRSFDLDIRAGVTGLQDLNGNSLSITPNAITHSSGRAIAIERDSQGRITRITDPEGASLVYEHDAAGDLVTVTDRAGETTRFSYDARHLLLDIQNPKGVQAVRNEYDDSGRLLRHTDAFGKVIEYTHDLAANQEIVTDRLGHTLLLEYDERGNVVREADAAGKETRRIFDADDRILEETDPLGNTRKYSYNAEGNPTVLTDQLGNRTVLTYDSQGRVLTVTDARGKTTANTYDERGNLLTTTDPLGQVTTYTYDGRGNVLTQVDAEGQTTERGYDSFGNVVREEDGLGHETTYTYDRNGKRLSRTTSRTTSSGQQTLTWTYSYDGLGRLIQATDPDGSAESMVYDGLGNVVERIDRLGRKTTFSYDELGRLTKTTYPDLTNDAATYDAEGRRTGSIDRAGRVTTFEYDERGRLIKTTYPGGSFVTNTFDVAGRLLTTTDVGGGVTSYEYDAAGRRTKIVNAFGQTTQLAYDANGNQISRTDAKGQTTTYEYDDLNRLTRVVFPDALSRSLNYDRVGRKVSETDPAGNTSRFTYDAAGRLAAVTDAIGKVTSYSYDEVGNRISQTDANGHTTSFEFDAHGRMTRRIVPLGAAETFEYDAAGSLVRRVDFSGAAVTYTYDTNQRLIRRSYPDGSFVSFTYTPAGRRATVTDLRGTSTYHYDVRDRLVSLTYPDGGAISYGYDEEGNRTSLTATLGSQALTTAYTYDALDRLESVIDPQGRVYTYSYDANGNRASLNHPNGVETTYSYDALNRLLNLTSRKNVGSVIQAYTYSLGPSGNRTRVEEHDGTVRSYQYDALYRLTRETISASAEVIRENAFAYDAVGNRLTQTKDDADGTETIAYTYDERDRLLQEGQTTYSWSDNGDLIAKSGADGASYVWDLDHRLVKVTKADGTVVTHAYDADGNRLRTEVTPPNGPPSVTRYLVDPSAPLSKVVAETDAEGSLTAYLVWGDDLLAVIRPTGTRFYHADGMGSIRALTDEAGSVTDTYSFSAFGELLSHVGSDPNAYLFAGEPLDPNTGFYYLRARWMDPQVGRFTSSDPLAGLISDPASLHRYLYVAADPVNRVDPSGMFEGLSGLMASNSIIGTIATTAIRTGAFALVGGGLGAVDAWLGDEPLWPAAMSGAAWGAGIGILWPWHVWRVFATLFMSVSGGIGAVNSFQSGKPAQGVFRIGLVLLMLRAGFGRSKPTTISRADPAGLERIRWHFESQVGDNAQNYPPNRAMLNRLAEGRWEYADQQFYKHELFEAELMEKGMPYDQAHEAALREFSAAPRDLYHPEVIQRFPDLFNDSWFTHWHLPPPQRGGQ